GIMATTKTNNDIIYLPLEGVDSEHCALIVDKGLAEIDGIDSHKVELNNRRAVLTLAGNEVLLKAVKTVQDLGYGVTTVKKSFPVRGVSGGCGGARSQRSVGHEPGGVSGSVNDGARFLQGEYFPNRPGARRV